MENRLVLQIKNRLAEIPAANEAASRWLAGLHAPSAADYLANLAIEELTTNLIKYGYDDTGDHIIEFELRLSPEEFVLAVTDDGRPFNPLDAPEPDTHLPVAERPIGGLGIHLLRQMTDGMTYTRPEGKNRLTLRKSLARSDGAAPQT